MSGEILDNLQRAITEYDKQAAASWASEALAQGLDPLDTMDAMTAAIRQVGDGFDRGELWLPDLLGAADAMRGAMPIIEDAIRRVGKQKEPVGVVVIGTVKGDLHDIGKNMVATLLTVEGFEVHDLGTNVPAEAFFAAIREHDADLLAMSALLTTTAPEQRKVIGTLEDEGLRDKVKVMVGGAAITPSFADEIRADGYAPTAIGAAKLARRLIVR